MTLLMKHKYQVFVWGASLEVFCNNYNLLNYNTIEIAVSKQLSNPEFVGGSGRQLKV